MCLILCFCVEWIFFSIPYIPKYIYSEASLINTLIILITSPSKGEEDLIVILLIMNLFMIH